MRFCVLNAALLFLAAPAWAKVPERFFSGIDPRYPDTDFVVGAGDGASLDVATARAYGTIAFRLQPQGTSSLEDVVSAETIAGQSQEKQTIKRTLAVQGRIDDWASLISVVDTYSEDSRVYVLAVVDRAKATGRLHAEAANASADLRDLDTRFNRDLQAGFERQAANTLKAMKAARARIKTSLAQASLLGDYPKATPMKAEAVQTVAAAEVRLRERWHKVVAGICVESDGDSSEGVAIRALLADILTGRGLQIRGCGAEDEDDNRALRFSLRIRMLSTTEPTALGPRTYTCQPTIQLESGKAAEATAMLTSTLTGESVQGRGKTAAEAVEDTHPKIRARLDEIVGEVVGD